MAKVKDPLRGALALALAAVMLLFCLPPRAMAAGPCSLRIECVYDAAAIPGVMFRLYRIADADGNLTEEFAGTGVTLAPEMSNKEWIEAANALTARVHEGALVPFGTGVTDEDGIVVFSGLQPGFYLVVGHKVDFNGKMYTAQTFIARVDGDVTAEPKFVPGDIPTLDSFAYAGDENPDMSSRTKWVLEDPDATITDEVTYTGLTPGKEYVLKGVLMNPETGETFRSGITAETVFVPEAESGTVEQTFTFNAVGFGGLSAVVFETLYREEYEMASHKELEDADQTVTFLTPPPSGEPAIGNLSVTKEVTGEGDRLKEWHITVTLEPRLNGTYGGYTFRDGETTFTLRGGETATVTGIPAGTRYRVTEAEAGADGYLTTFENAVGVVNTGMTARATCTNDLPPETPKGDLTVEKRVEGVGDPTWPWNFTVTLEPKLNGTYSDMTFVDGVCKFTLKHGETKTASGLPAGTGFTVTEAEAGQDGYVTEAENESGEVAADAAAYVTFVNRLDSPDQIEKTGLLTVSKTVTGTGDTEKEWNFTVTLGDTGISGVYGGMTFTNGVAEFTLKHGESKTASGLPAGTRYTVTEREANQNGYTATSTGETGNIPDGGTARAKFVNDKSEPPDDTPKTGDDSRLGFWLTVMIVSLLGMALSLAFLFSKRGSDRARDKRK